MESKNNFIIWAFFSQTSLFFRRPILGAKLTHPCVSNVIHTYECCPYTAPVWTLVVVVISVAHPFPFSRLFLFLFSLLCPDHTSGHEQQDEILENSKPVCKVTVYTPRWLEAFHYDNPSITKVYTVTLQYFLAFWSPGFDMSPSPYSWTKTDI